MLRQTHINVATATTLAIMQPKNPTKLALGLCASDKKANMILGVITGIITRNVRKAHSFRGGMDSTFIL